MGFAGGSEVKVSAWNAGDPGSIPGQREVRSRMSHGAATHTHTQHVMLFLKENNS